MAMADTPKDTLLQRLALLELREWIRYYVLLVTDKGIPFVMLELFA